MKRTYESFKELAECMTRGDGILHALNCVYEKDFLMDTCYAWQSGVTDFAEWLDHIGARVEVPDDKPSFYDFMSKRAERVRAGRIKDS